MKKTLKKRLSRGQKNLQVYACLCDCTGCSGCGGSSSSDYLNVKTNRHNNIYGTAQKAYYQ